MANNSELDSAFQELEQDFGYAKEVRREIINNLRVEAAKVRIEPTDKAMMVTAKMSIIKTLDDMLKSDSALTLDKLKMKLARKDSETNGLVGQTIAAMLKNMRVNDGLGQDQSKDPTEGAMEELTERAKALETTGDEKTKKALAISDGETQECGGLPTTSAPVANLKPLKTDDEDEL